MRKRSTSLTSALPAARLLYSVDEAAAVMGIGHSQLWDLVLRRQIASIKIGRSRRVPVSALQSYIVEQLGELEQERS